MPVIHLTLVALVSLGAACPAPIGIQQQGMEMQQKAARARLKEARTLLDSGRFGDAKDAFTWSVNHEMLLESSERAAAHFGRGVSIQEIFRAPDAPDFAPDVIETAIADYRVARQLDSTRYFVSSHYNSALLLGARGEHDVAAQYLTEAARASTGADRSRLLLRAARELDMAGDTISDSGALYRELLNSMTSPAPSDSFRVEARLALAKLPAKVGADTVAAWLGAMVRDSALAARVAETAIVALGKLPPESSHAADSLLLTLAMADVNAHVSIEYFAQTQRTPLEQVAVQLPNLRGAIHAFIAAYDGLEVPPRGDPSLSQSPWWNAWNGSWDRRHVWTQVLRTVGEWNERSGKTLLAAQYYEAALGYPAYEITPWADLDAMLPLILLMDSLATTSPLVSRDLDKILNFAFTGKSQAYARDEQARIRQFHMTLGAYYAKRQQWLGQPRGAIYQLEHMRQATKRLAAIDRDSYDPPQLVEKLMDGYLATNMVQKARGLLPDLQSANKRSGRRDNSQQWRVRIESVARTEASIPR